jgi:hypothetical protein
MFGLLCMLFSNTIEEEQILMKTSESRSVSDSIRGHIGETYLKAAQRRGDRTFTVNVGAVHRALGLTNRVPQVCSALESKKLLEENRLKIISKTGPPSGQSTTVTFTYEILDPGGRSSSGSNPLIDLRGVAKDVFRELGGGESFIQSERNQFAGTDELKRKHQ